MNSSKSFYRDPLAQARLSSAILLADPPRASTRAQFRKTRNLLAGSSRGTAASRSRRIIFVVNRYSELSLLDLLRNTWQPPRRGCGESERRRLSPRASATLAPRPRKRGRSPARRIPSRVSRCSSREKNPLSGCACPRKSGLAYSDTRQADRSARSREDPEIAGVGESIVKPVINSPSITPPIIPR